MMKKIISVFMIVASLMIVTSVLAENTATVTNTLPTATTVTTTSQKIACVKTAIAVRENALAGAITTYNTAISAAYATRANELAGAYSNTTVKKVQAGVKVSWADFKKSIKSANKAWVTNRNTAWSTFKTATKACKSPAGVSDSANSVSEMKGQ
jgi:hypothetical protein